MTRWKLLLVQIFPFVFGDFNLPSANIDVFDQIEILKKEMKMREEKLQSEIIQLKSEMYKMKSAIENIGSDLDILKDPPSEFVCGYSAANGENDGNNPSDSPIVYEKLFYQRSNIDKSLGLEVSTGLYTGSFPGTYMVTYGLTKLIYINILSLRYLLASFQLLMDLMNRWIYSGFIRENGGRLLVIVKFSNQLYNVIKRSAKQRK